MGARRRLLGLLGDAITSPGARTAETEAGSVAARGADAAAGRRGSRAADAGRTDAPVPWADAGPGGGDPANDLTGGLVTRRFTRDAPSLREMWELNPMRGGGLYQQSLASSAQRSPFGAAVYVGAPEEYTAGKRLFMTPDYQAGFALSGDDVVGVFNTPGSPYRSAADAMLPLAVQQGGRRLDAFDTVLPDIYARSGFRPVARVPFNDEYAPPAWDYERFAPWNKGRPDVVLMAHDPRPNRPPYARGQGVPVPDFDAGLEEVRRFLQSVERYR